MDPSSFRLLGDYGESRFLDEVAGAAALFPNREGTTLTGHEDPDRTAVALARRFPVVAVKPGEEGCLVAAGGRSEAVLAAHPCGPAVDPIATLFVAALLLGAVLALPSTSARAPNPQPEPLKPSSTA